MSDDVVRLVLASQSPRRRELLSLLPWNFMVRPADIDESPLKGESPAAYVLRLASEKARVVAGQYETPGLVLGADTIVVCGQEILGKPSVKMPASTMLGKLSGRTHQVMTAIALCKEHACHTRLVTTEVTFRFLSNEDISWYIDTGEPDDKAGAYGIQGLGGRFVERIDGSYSSVVGLPMVETELLINQCIGSEPREVE